MPWLRECSDWRLLQTLATRLSSRKASCQPAIRDWQKAAGNQQNDYDRKLEAGLRQIFIPRPVDISVSDDDLKECRLKLKELCNLLESAVRIEGSTDTEKFPKYRLLHGLIEFLEELNRYEPQMFDLVSGPNPTLFGFRQESRQADLQLLDECNRLIQRVFQKSEQPPAEHSYKPKQYSWKDSNVRDQASTAFGLLFERFTCDSTHEVLMKVTEDVSQNQEISGLQLLLSSCTNPDKWQEIICGSKYSGQHAKRFHDLCVEMEQFAGQGQELHVLAQSHELLGTWTMQAIGKPSLQAPKKQSLDEMISNGKFAPLSPSSFFNQPSITRFGLKEKRALAVKLGHCLLDFFDSKLDSKSIYFLVPYGGRADAERLYLSFSSRLPSSPEFRRFQMGHPVLLSFAKILLELDDGQSLPFEINPYYGIENSQIWFKFMQYVELKQSERNDSYIDAVRGCLNVHSQLLCVDSRNPQADYLIRKELYHHVVHKLELALEECTPRSIVKRKRSISPPSLSIEAESASSFIESTTSSPAPLSNLYDISPWSQFPKRGRTSETIGNSQRSISPYSQNSQGRHSLQRATPAEEFSSSEEERGYFHSNAQFTTHSGRDYSSEMLGAPRSRKNFEVAIICALSVEYDAVLLLFDEFWGNGDRYGKAHGDLNTYRTGRIGNLNVVLLRLPEMGKSSAAGAAAALRSSYQKLKFVILTGVCGGIPNIQTEPTEQQEVMLGDVIISKNIVQYDLGRRYPDYYETKHNVETSLGRPPKLIRNFIASLESNYAQKELQERTIFFLEQIQQNEPRYDYPGVFNDRLFETTYRHKHRGGAQCSCANSNMGLDLVCDTSRMLSCEELGCEEDHLVKRDRAQYRQRLEEDRQLGEAQKPSIFIGRVGSGDTVVKSGEERDAIAEKCGVIALEMEGAGIWDEVNCIVVKGVCDYADSHKNKRWQGFAAATAASVVKALLERYTDTDARP